MGEFLKGKSIAVTGAGRGIGRAVAMACAAEGANVVVADYGVAADGSDPTSEVADAVVKEITDAGGVAIAVADTVTTMEGGARIVQTAVDAWGRIDGVVCIAGILRERMLFNMSEDEWDPVVETHLKGTFTVFRHASALMRKQQSGTLIGFTSGAFQGSAAQANYSAAKGGIVSLVHSAALGLQKYGVTANCIAPDRPHPHVGQRADGAGRDRRRRGRGAHGGVPPLRPGPPHHRPALHRGRRQDRRVEPARRGAGHVHAPVVGPPKRSRPASTAPSARRRCRSCGRSRSMRQAAAAGEKPNV